MGGRVAGWVGGLSENGNKAISASIEVEVELSWVEAELGNFGVKKWKITDKSNLVNLLSTMENDIVPGDF